MTTPTITVRKGRAVLNSIDLVQASDTAMTYCFDFDTKYPECSAGMGNGLFEFIFVTDGDYDNMTFVEFRFPPDENWRCASGGSRYTYLAAFYRWENQVTVWNNEDAP